MKAIRKVLGLSLALALAAGAFAQPGKPAAAGSRAALEETALRQLLLKNAFESFYRRLALLATRMENGTAADRARAEPLRRALKLVGTQNTEAKFDSLIASLRDRKASESLDVLHRAAKDFKELREDLRNILALLLEDGPAKNLANQIEKALALLDRLKDARNQQARLQAQTENGKQENGPLAKTQARLEAKTGKILESDLDGKDKDPLEKVRKPVENAVGEQGKARARLGKNDRDAAGDAQGRAVGFLDQAIRELEAIIRQNRREEHQARLNDLLSRCRRMLQVQREVRDGSAALQRDVARSPEGKPALEHAARANRLSDQEQIIVREAGSALKVIRDDGSVVAFAEAFEQVEKDAEIIRERLAATDVGTVTLRIEDDVIEMLTDMIKSLQKAISDPPEDEPVPPGYGPYGNPPLVDVSQELKMIRAMQGRIRGRTALYGKTYKGEQAPPPEGASDAKEKEQRQRVQTELKDLAGRQKRLAKVTREVNARASRPGSARID